MSLWALFLVSQKGKMLAQKCMEFLGEELLGGGGGGGGGNMKQGVLPQILNLILMNSYPFHSQY